MILPFFPEIEIYRVLQCEVLLESSLNVECSLGRFEPFDALNDTKKLTFSMTYCATSG